MKAHLVIAGSILGLIALEGSDPVRGCVASDP
jgi:hypothetical protein